MTDQLANQLTLNYPISEFYCEYDDCNAGEYMTPRDGCNDCPVNTWSAAGKILSLSFLLRKVIISSAIHRLYLINLVREYHLTMAFLLQLLWSANLALLARSPQLDPRRKIVTGLLARREVPWPPRDVLSVPPTPTLSMPLPSVPCALRAWSPNPALDSKLHSFYAVTKLFPFQLIHHVY